MINIQNIPLINMNEEDCLSWKARKDGNYTVKTGYYNILSWNKGQDKESSSYNHYLDL